MITLENISYTYPTTKGKKEVLTGINGTFEQGKFTAIVGKSGSGKTTLLSLLSKLDDPSTGRILVNGMDLKQMEEDDYRCNKISIIYQNLNLFPLLTVLENVMYPMQMNKVPKKEAMQIARELLQKVELPKEYEEKLPSNLSGGEQQRVAIARALGNKGKIIIADEPTGNLDNENTDNIVNILFQLAHEENYCVVVVTHDDLVAQKADVVYELKEGKGLFLK